MRRREFIGLVAGAAVAHTSVGRAQQVSQPIVGFFSTRSPDDSKDVLAAFHRGLGEAGYTEGRNVLIEYRWANGEADRLPQLAHDLVRRQVSLIASVGGEPGIFAAKQSTTAIPIVFVGGSDPAKTGLVDSINRPTGNLTGVTLHSNALEPKKLQLLRELVPAAATIAVLLNPQTQMYRSIRADVEAAAASLGQGIQLFDARTAAEIEQQFSEIAKLNIRALLVGGNPFFSQQRRQIVDLAARYSIPAIYDSKIQVVEGGLISYGSSYTDAYRQAGVYAGRVLRGAKIADLPVVFPSKFEMAINLKTAKALHLDIPLRFQQLADEVIE